MSDKNTPQVVIVGLGQTGLSCVRYFHRKNVPVAVTDTREHPPGLETLTTDFPDVPFAGGGLNNRYVETATELVVSPGVSIHTPEIAKRINQGVKPMGDIELFIREAKAPIIAISGSNAKTTVTTLIGEMLSAAGHRAEVCGNIGEPVLDLLDCPTPDFYVVEISSFQLETTYSLQAAVATVLNVSPDHMDRYASYADYLQAKQRIYQHCQHAILNYDQPEVWQDLSLMMPRSGFSLNVNYEKGFHLAEQGAEIYLAYEQELLLPAKAIKLNARHHLQNALSALAIGHAIDLSIPVMLDVLKRFNGLPHRCQLVVRRRGVSWYNDSKGTNVGATIAAIESCAQLCQGNLLLIAGGQGKSADFSPLQQLVEQSVDHVILFGEDAKKIEKSLNGCVSLRLVDSLSAAVMMADELSKANDIVLFSPACASLDMFKNYMERGEVFEKLVRGL